MWLNIFCGAIILIVVAMTWTEGLWSNLLSMFNAIFAGIIATNLFEPVARKLDDYAPAYTYFTDFLMLWLIFAVSYAILRSITDALSPTRVRFKLPIEVGGRALFGFLTGWVVVCFFLFSLHTAPLARTAFGGAFGKSPTESHFFLSPDHLWLGFIHSRSAGAFAKSTPTPFDPKAEFILKYGERRHRLEQLPGMTVDARNR